MEIQARILRPLALPQTHRVVVEGPRIARLKFRETAETLDDFRSLAWGTVVGFGQKKIAAGVGGIQIGGPQQGFDRVVIVTARVESHP